MNLITGNNIMAKKRKLIREETFKKDVMYDKKEAIKLLDDPETDLTVVKVGKYDDGKEFIVLKIEI